MNIPYTNEDLGTELVIVVIDNDKKGLFIIPNEVAIRKKILSTKNSKGKMSMRFYPPWCTNLNTLEKLNYKNDFEKFLVDSYLTQRLGSYEKRTKSLC